MNSTVEHFVEVAKFHQYITDIEVVCGDCMGDAFYPEPTFLLADGGCSRCGGHNYVESHEIFSALERYLRQQGEPRPS